MTKKQIIDKLIEKEKISKFKNLSEMRDFLNIYCYENIKSLKELKENYADYIIKYDNAYYYCFFDGIARYFNDGLCKNFELLDTVYDWIYDVDNLENIIINGLNYKIYIDSNNYKCVIINAKRYLII